MADELIQLSSNVSVPTWAVRVSYARSSGPGGQNVNKVNSKAEVWLSLSGLHAFGDRVIARAKSLAGRRLTEANEIHIACEVHRSQHQNREEAFTRLADLITAAMTEPKVRRPTKVSRGAKRKRLASKRKRSAIKSNRSGAIEDE